MSELRVKSRFYSRYFLDALGRWYPVINVFLVIFMLSVLIILVIIDVYRTNSFILNIITSGTMEPKPEIVVGVASVFIGGAVAALIWAYNDTKNRFVWVELARSEVDSVLLMLVEDFYEMKQSCSEEFCLRLPSNVDEPFNANSSLYIFLNFRAYRFLKIFFREMRFCADTSNNKKLLSAHEIERVKCAILFGVIASRILASNLNAHEFLVSELYDDVKNCRLRLGGDCIAEVEKYFVVC